MGGGFELTQQVQAAAGILAPTACSFRIPSFLNGTGNSTTYVSSKAEASTSFLQQTLEPPFFLGLFSPVCNVPHPALASRGPTYQRLLDVLNSLLCVIVSVICIKVTWIQGFHISQLPQLFC